MTESRILSPETTSRAPPAAAGLVSLRGFLDADETEPTLFAKIADALGREETWIRLWLGGAILACALAAMWSALPPGRLAGRAGQAPPAARAAPVAAAPVKAEAGAEAMAPEFRLQDLSPAEAQMFNALVPFSTEPNPPARPFRLVADHPQDELRALDCLTAAVYYEAASEPLDGQRAVAQVVLNRLRDPAFPKSVCGVVFQGSELPTGWQFSFTGDGSLARKPSAAAWARARAVAEAALHGYVAKAVGQATHYHTVWVAPYWSPRLAKVANIGAHIFYRWLGARGMPGAFTGIYAGSEPFLAQIAALDPEVTETPVVVAIKAPDEQDDGDQSPAVPEVVKVSDETTITPPAPAPTAPPVVEVAPPPAVLQGGPQIPAQAMRPRQNRRVAFGSGF